MWSVRSHFKTLSVAVQSEPSLQQASPSKLTGYAALGRESNQSRRGSNFEVESKPSHEEDVLTKWSTDGIDGILALARIVAEMLESIVTENESAVITTTSANERSPRQFNESLSTCPGLPPKKRPSFTKSASLSRMSPGGAQAASTNVESSPSLHASDAAHMLRAEDLVLAGRACKYLRAKVYLGALLFVLRVVVPAKLPPTASVISSAQFPRSDAKSFVPARSAHRQSVTTGASSSLSIPDYSKDGAAKFVEIDLAKATLQFAGRGELRYCKQTIRCLFRHTLDYLLSLFSQENILESLIERHNSVLELAVRRIRDFVLCSYHFSHRK